MAEAQSAPPPSAPPVWGYADLHNHLFGNDGFGGLGIWGDVYNPDGDISKALAWDDFTPANYGDVLAADGTPVDPSPSTDRAAPWTWSTTRWLVSSATLGRARSLPAASLRSYSGQRWTRCLDASTSQTAVRTMLRVSSSIITSSAFATRSRSLSPTTALAEPRITTACWALMPKAFQATASAPSGPNCNSKGLTNLGIALTNAAMDQKIIIDVDHSSARAFDGILQIATQRNYPDIVAGHTGVVDLGIPGQGGNSQRHEARRVPPQAQGSLGLGRQGLTAWRCRLQRMDQNAIMQYVTETFDGLDVLRPTDGPGAGDTFFYYDPEHTIDPSKRLPFATIVTKNSTTSPRWTV